MLYSFSPCFSQKKKPESDQLCFWSICGHFEFFFFPSIDVFCYIHQKTGGKINPAIDGSKWFFMFYWALLPHFKIIFSFWRVVDGNKSITRKYVRGKKANNRLWLRLKSIVCATNATWKFKATANVREKSPLTILKWKIPLKQIANMKNSPLWYRHFVHKSFECEQKNVSRDKTTKGKLCIVIHCCWQRGKKGRKDI